MLRYAQGLLWLRHEFLETSFPRAPQRALITIARKGIAMNDTISALFRKSHLYPVNSSRKKRPALSLIRLRVLLFLLIAGVLGMTATAPALAATFTVDTTTDELDGSCADGDCSLRDAVSLANANGEADTITLPAGTYLINIPGPFPNPDEDGNLNGDLDIASEITINGAGQDVTIIDGANDERVFEALPGANLTITGVTVQNGNAQFLPSGGGIYSNNATLTMEGCTVSGNSADWGGGIWKKGTATLTDCTISGNTATADYVGGIENNDGLLTLDGCTISGNTSAVGAGGLCNDNSARLVALNCTISGNTAATGGGGAAFFSSDAELSFVTVTNNTADSDGNGSGNGGGIWNNDPALIIKNSIIAGNTDRGGEADDIAGAVTYEGDNVIGGDPLLGPLQNNGGMTDTHALLAGSPAVDAATDCTAVGGTAVTLDQRDIPRPRGTSCDIGACESPFSDTVIFLDDDLDWCFIATAAYGSYLDPHVMALREFRDSYLLTNPAGKACVQFYYRASPPIARYIGKHEALRTATCWLLTPMVCGVKYPAATLVVIVALAIIGLRGGRAIRLRLQARPGNGSV
jgi:CSLREA domain-containing protein